MTDLKNLNISIFSYNILWKIMDDKPNSLTKQLGEEKINQLANECSVLFDVQLEKQLNLLTIRHYNFEIMNEMVSSKDLLLEQKTKETLQCVYRTT